MSIDDKSSRPPFNLTEHRELCEKLAAHLAAATNGEPARALSALLTISAELTNCLPNPEGGARAFVEAYRASMRTPNTYFARKTLVPEMRG